MNPVPGDPVAIGGLGEQGVEALRGGAAGERDREVVARLGVPPRPPCELFGGGSGHSRGIVEDAEFRMRGGQGRFAARD